MSDTERRLRPRAFRLNGDETAPPANGFGPARAGEARAGEAQVEESAFDPFTPDMVGADLSLEEEERAVEQAQKKGLLRGFLFSWGGVFVSCLTGLASLGVSLWAAHIVDDLFSRSAALGLFGLILAAGFALAALALLAREIFALMRQNRIAKLHIAIARAHAEDDSKAARAHLRELCKIYEKRPETGRARAHIVGLSKEIVDGRDLIDLAERSIMTPLDAQVRREIAAASKRVSVVVAVSPKAIFDFLFVAGQAIVLMRKIAEIYGGRPGLFGFFKLARSVGVHLAITGSLAVGDTLLQQILGHGIAAKLSARLGEGVLNGLLTARVGLSAMAVCRPMPFNAEKPPGVADVAPFLFGDKKKSAGA